MDTKTKKETAEALAKALKGTSERERFLHRLHCVKLVLHGLSCSEAARIYGDSPRSVAYWLKQFEQNGIEGLGEESRSGRPSKLAAPQLRKVSVFVRKSAAPVTGRLLSKHILESFGVSLTDRQCWRLIKRFTEIV